MNAEEMDADPAAESAPRLAGNGHFSERKALAARGGTDNRARSSSSSMIKALEKPDEYHTLFTMLNLRRKTDAQRSR